MYPGETPVECGVMSHLDPSGVSQTDDRARTVATLR